MSTIKSLLKKDGSTWIFSFTVLIILLITIKVLIAHNTRHSFHHQTVEVVEVNDCYKGSVTLCDVVIKPEYSNDTETYEHSGSIINVGDTLYRKCYYRGLEYDDRMCYPTLIDDLENKYKVHYNNLVKDYDAT